MKKFLVAICAATLLFSGCGNDKTAEQSKPTPKVEQTTQTPADEAKVKETIQATTQAPPPAPAKVLNLGMTFEQFKAAYNAKIAEYAPETGWDVSSMLLGYKKNHDSLFSYKFNERIAMIGVADENSSMIKKVIIASKPQNQTDYETALVIYLLVISTISPEISYDDRSKLFEELRLWEDFSDTYKDLSQQGNETLRGNVKYSTAYDIEKKAFHFWASAKDL